MSRKKNKNNKSLVVVNEVRRKKRGKKKKGVNWLNIGKRVLGGAITGISPMLGPLAPVGAAVGTLLGSGAYRMNTLADRITASDTGLSVQVPYMHSSDDAFKLSHREYLRDISSTTDFDITHYPINPGVASSFPWLSSIAGNFTEFRFTGLAYEFKSTSADALNSTNTALGTVIMSPKYNLEAPDFVSKMEMEAQMGAVSCKPAQSMVCLVECAPNENIFARQFIRTGEEVSTSLLYDLGEMCLATVGSQAVATIGELWVTYEVELYKPKFGAGALLQNALWHKSYATGVASGTTVLGTSATRVVVHDNFPGDKVTFTGTDARVITLPPHMVGAYLLVIEWDGAGISWTAPSHSLSAGLDDNVLPFWTVSSGDLYYFNAPASGVTSVTHAVKLIAFRVIDYDTENEITIGSSGTVPNSQRCTINIWQIHDASTDPSLSMLSSRALKRRKEERRFEEAFKRFKSLELEDDFRIKKDA